MPRDLQSLNQLQPWGSDSSSGAPRVSHRIFSRSLRRISSLSRRRQRTCVGASPRVGRISNRQYFESRICVPCQSSVFGRQSSRFRWAFAGEGKSAGNVGERGDRGVYVDASLCVFKLPDCLPASLIRPLCSEPRMPLVKPGRKRASQAEVSVAAELMIAALLREVEDSDLDQE